MPRRPRRNHSPAFKAKVALEAIKGEEPLIADRRALRRPPQPDHQVEAAALGGRRRRLRRGRAGQRRRARASPSFTPRSASSPWRTIFCPVRSGA